MQNLKSFFQSAATVLAPPIENDYDEFYQAWCAIKDYYGETKMDKIAVQNTMIPDQLTILIEKLRRERHMAGIFDTSDDEDDDEGYDEASESTNHTPKPSSAQASMRVGAAAAHAEVSNPRLPPSGPVGNSQGLGAGGSVKRGDETPCLEYMLNHVFSTLCVLGQGDTPVGMKEEVLQFLTTFLKDNAFGIHADMRARRLNSNSSPGDDTQHVRHSEMMNTNIVLPHAKVAGPLMDLIRACHKPKMSLYEEDVANILFVLAHLLRDNPTCVPRYFAKITEENRTHVESLGYGDGDVEFFILDALTDLLSSEDTQVVNRACESILALVACDSPLVVDYISKSRRLTTLLMDRLSAAFEALPSERGTSEQDKKRLIRSLDSFKAWATYVDRVFCKSVGLDDHLAELLHSNFFVPCLEKKLRETNEMKTNADTRYLIYWLSLIKSQKAVDAASKFLLGNDMVTPEVRSSSEDSDEAVPLRKVLLNRCESLSPKLTNATLQIFEVLLQRFTSHTYGNLVLRNFPDGTFAQSTSSGIIAAWEKVEVWTQLVPNELRPEKIEGEEDDYHNYYLEAQKHAADCAAAKAKWGGSAGGLGQDVVEFYEGDFLRMLLQKMQRMLDEPYGEMLRVSALLSHLATFPNEQLRSFLLNPKCDVPQSVLTLYSSLEIVMAELSRRAGAIDNFQALVTRAKLALSEKGMLREEDDPDLWEYANEVQATILLDEFVKEIASCCMVSNESSA